MANLPAYITNKQRDPNALSLAQRGLQNVGSPVGPHMSIRGNRFTLVDAAGDKIELQTLFADICIFDINDHVSKSYRDDIWDPDNPTPPVCWSHNGLAPSSEVSPANAQALTCDMCPHNVWGSKQSAKGNDVQACRDEQNIAFIVAGMTTAFRLVIPPGSFGKPTGWKAYLAKFKSAGFDIDDIWTRLTFKLNENGILEFNPAPSPWLDEATMAVRDKALAAKASDIIVGRLDRPRQGVMPALGLAAPLAPVTNGVVQQVEQRPLPSEPQQQTVFGTTQATPVSAVSQGAANTPQAQTSDPPQRRRRRTQAEMAAANEQVPAPAAGGQMAPFRPEAAQPAAGAAQQVAQPAFGVGAGVAPNPELQAAINNIFGT